MTSTERNEAMADATWLKYQARRAARRAAVWLQVCEGAALVEALGVVAPGTWPKRHSGCAGRDYAQALDYYDLAEEILHELREQAAATVEAYPLTLTEEEEGAS